MWALEVALGAEEALEVALEVALGASWAPEKVNWLLSLTALASATLPEFPPPPAG